MVWNTCQAALQDTGRMPKTLSRQRGWSWPAKAARRYAWGETVAPWLHETAILSRQAGVSLDPSCEIAGKWLWLLIVWKCRPTSKTATSSTCVQEGLGRLPRKLRAPIVLCYLEGRTNTEAARLLGWPEGSIAKRPKPRPRNPQRMAGSPRRLSVVAGLDRTAVEFHLGGRRPLSRPPP